MGMIYETADQRSPSFKATQFNGISTQSFAGSSFPTVHKEQLGYRSGPLSEVELDALWEYQKHSTLGMTRSSVEHLERIMRANNSGSGGNVNPFMVNPRDYLQVDSTPGAVELSGQYSPSGVTPATRVWTWVGSLGLNSFSTTVLADHPSEGDLRAWGAKILRGSRPTRPDFDLTRFVGELKDANRLFQLPASAGSKAIGQSYLGGQFGWKPTADDIKRGAEAILAADQKYVKFLENSNREYVFRKKEAYNSSSTTGSFNSPASTVTGPVNYTVSGLGVLRMQCPQTGSSMRPFGVDWTIVQQEFRNVFATYLWFSYDPDEFSIRRQSYIKKAQKVLGGGLTVSTAYELLPFSWMVDWFYDIGGLLAYQQDVADYNLVAKRMGVSYTRTFSVELKSKLPNNTSFFKGVSASGAAYARVRQNIRYPGNPYDMSTSSWTDILKDPFRASILAALGFTKAKNIPFIR